MPHLIRRFFGALGSRRPSPNDQLFIAEHLEGTALRMFGEQQVIDQAHALRCARRVQSVAAGRSDLIQAALLHDVGKRHSRLGVTGRVVASLSSRLRLPMNSRMRSYLDHGRLGATDVTSLDLPRIVAAFAGHDEDLPPTGIDPEDWAHLRLADGE